MSSTPIIGDILKSSYKILATSHFDIKIGDRIAQIIFEPILLNELVEVKKLPTSERNTSGFGSTRTN